MVKRYGAPIGMILGLALLWLCGRSHGGVNGQAVPPAAAGTPTVAHAPAKDASDMSKLIRNMQEGSFLEARRAIEKCVERNCVGLVRAALKNPNDDIKTLAARELVQDAQRTTMALVDALERSAGFVEGGDEVMAREVLRQRLVQYIGRLLGREYALTDPASPDEPKKLALEMRRELAKRGDVRD